VCGVLARGVTLVVFVFRVWVSYEKKKRGGGVCRKVGGGGGGGMKYSERNLFHFHFIDQKSHMCSPRLVFLVRVAGDECGALVD